MKMPRQATWAGFLTGCCLVGVIAAVGLTDRACGDDEGRGGAPAAGETKESSALKNNINATQAELLLAEPIITFTEHLNLWGPLANEAVTWDEMARRLHDLAKNGPVRPHFKFTNGVYRDDAYDELQDHIMRASRTGKFPKFDGLSLGSIPPAASERLDAIETPAELKPDPADRLTGRVLQPDGETPAAGGQVVVIAPGVKHRGPLPVTLVDGGLRGPVSELWAPTNDKGEFAVYPESDDRAIAILHSSGFCYIPAGQVRGGKAYTLVPWATIKIDTTKLADDERLSLTSYPKGAEETAGFKVYLSEHRREGQSPTAIKIPAGRVRVSRGIQLDQGTTVSTQIDELSLEPGDAETVQVSSTSPEEREELKATFRRFDQNNAEMLDLKENLMKQEQRDRIQRARQQLSPESNE